jgi:hypothetical protein
MKRAGILPITVLIVTILFQGLNTLDGIHNWGDKAWFSTSYAEHATQLTKSDTLLLASFPEPYYFVTKLSTHSICDTYPYIYIPDSLTTAPFSSAKTWAYETSSLTFLPFSTSTSRIKKQMLFS